MQASRRRLHDGAGRGSSWSVPTLLIVALLCGAALASVPTHDSFDVHLMALSSHPSGAFGRLASLTERVRIATLADSKSHLLWRVGSFRGSVFVGVFGTWLTLPLLPTVSLPALSPCGAGSLAPHETFVLLTLVVYALWLLAPRFTARHTFCSLRAVGEGRVWTLLTSNLAHASPQHLIINSMQLMHFGPLIHAQLGCERFAALLGCACIATSGTSLLWSGVRARRREGSIGASGVAMALLAANAALFSARTYMYGVEMPASTAVLVYLVLDLLSQQGATDVSAHAGGAACGFVLARRWGASASWLW